MTKRHEIVGKDWVVADVVTTFCREFGLPFRQGGLNITYRDEIQKLVGPGSGERSTKAVVRVASWPEGIVIEMDLRTDLDRNAWLVYGELKIFGPPAWFPADSEKAHFKKHVVGRVARTAFTVLPPQGGEDSYSFEEREMAGSGSWYLTYVQDHPTGFRVKRHQVPLVATKESKAIEEAEERWNEILRERETPMSMADEQTPYNPSVTYKIPL